jgi:hypothetical protein
MAMVTSLAGGTLNCGATLTEAVTVLFALSVAAVRVAGESVRVVVVVALATVTVVVELAIA